MPLGMRGLPCSTSCMVGRAIVFSSPCRPTEPRPQKRTKAPTHRMRTRMSATRDAGQLGRARGSRTSKRPANEVSSLSILVMRFVQTSRGSNPAHDRYESPRFLSASIRLLVAQQFHRREEQDLQIEQRRPAPKILQVVIDARLHVLYVRGLAPATIDLCQAGDARGHFVPDHVALDELAVFLVVSD